MRCPAGSHATDVHCASPRGQGCHQLPPMTHHQLPRPQICSQRRRRRCCATRSAEEVTAALPKQSSCRDVTPVTLPRCEHHRELTNRRMTSCPGSWNPQRCRQLGGRGDARCCHPFWPHGLCRRPAPATARRGRRGWWWRWLGFDFRPESPGANDVRRAKECLGHPLLLK
jgi:hypothetical protein